VKWKLITTLPGIVENGQIRLNDSEHLGEKAVVYVGSPRLVHPEQAADFEKVVEDIRDAGV
jgi:hypothetical protein